MMPGMDGHSLVRKLADRSPAPAVLLVSGYPITGGGAVRTVDPAAVFLAKPFRREALAKKVREALGGRERHEAGRRGGGGGGGEGERGRGGRGKKGRGALGGRERQEAGRRSGG